MKILTERVGEKPQIRRSKDTNLLWISCLNN
jgi:hypothetical protein